MSIRIVRSWATLVLVVGCGSDGSSDGSADATDTTGTDTEPTSTMTVPTTADSTGGELEDAEVVDAGFPVVIACGGVGLATITMRNTGMTTWTAAEGYALGAVDDSDPLHADGRVPLPDAIEIAPGQSHTFEIELDAPGTDGAVTSDWQMVHEQVRWFGDAHLAGVDIACDISQGGPVRLDGRSFADDGGPFVSLGVTMMWAAWAYRNDRPRLEANLQVLADSGFGSIRALGVVGDPAARDYWDGREIELGWDDYAEVIRGTSELAWDEYGLRVEWTLIGDGQITVPTPRMRDALQNEFLALAEARPDTILHLELANEAWQNGFAGDDGLAELRARTSVMRDSTDVLVAASAAVSDGCSDMLALYDGDIADIATVHTDRDLGTAAGPWGPVLRPLAVNTCSRVLIPTNNEPIGPGASVASEDDPERLVAAAIATWLAGWPSYVFHTNVGVRGFEDFATVPSIGAFAAIVPTLPGDLASWDRRGHADPAAALMAYATVGGELVPDALWTEVGGEAGVAGLLQSESGNDVIALAVGILGDATFGARVALEIEVIDLLSANTISTLRLGAGETFVLAGAGARLLRGRRVK